MDPEPPSAYCSLIPFGFILLSSSGSVLFFGILLLILLLMTSAMISGSEVAYFSLRSDDFSNLKEQDSKSATQVLRLKEKPRFLLATILITNNFINIGIVLLADFLIQGFFGQTLFGKWGLQLSEILDWPAWTAEEWTRTLEFTITVVSVTFLLVLFGEVAPKIYARFNNLSFAKKMAGTLTLLMSLCYPFSKILVNWTTKLERRIDENRSSDSNKTEIEEAIELTVSGHDTAKEEMDILKNIINFNEVTVKQIMCSRVDTVSAGIEESLKELIKLIKASGYSRIPIIEEDFDHIVGLLYAKDLIGHQNDPNYNWHKVIRRDVHYVPESKRINELLKEFQEMRIHMAIVVDEFGGASGLVTLEDIMEEVIGEITDEFDEGENIVFRQINDYTFIFEGKTLLNDVSRIIDVGLDEFDEYRGEADSIAGLMLEHFGVIPKMNQEIKGTYFDLKAEKVNKRRIQEVRIKIKKTA